TPYCGGCFEFDVLVPADYPSSPPKVILTTTGQGSVRFNPNLYNCGKVCLSLLGTWSGEKWDPEVSSLSQVINSILFLIFVEHPYFNEPGYQASQGTPIGDIHSAGYNRKIRQGTLQFGYIDHFKK
ncbi:ubiquitin-conjugating enzyme/RWD-like protein, partial [Ochromonadaceae sp. CCMP2298]